ncbi:cbb3-type cytochrome oxidase maturation protein [Duganella sp. 3397]|uniref:Cytochrome oxidase maturation protein cbb3-type n=1 Tax=Duganella phyllosphaerae TaxID=762836 RepID=A0A1E7WEL8_9BURK|nr:MULTISPECIES: cbb3-type cytochrome oxidase assembly protein CcoS [Duganella]MDR7047781.1 cbb3-type cytochrome oxidase maturation protein [Duganella sp. 3397]OEZ96693.1 cytochrome oxidase maturation protein cbb3-type [Duganella phyllosphaerae]
MEALLLLIPLSVLLVFVALWVFFRASDDGQFDDLVGPGLRVLQDDDRPQHANNEDQSSVRNSNSSGNSTTSSILRK